MADEFTIGDRYELEPLPRGRGGMGQVYFGTDRVLGRRVAVKFLVFRDGVHDPKLVERFRREARLTAGLEHPGVPALYDVGMNDGKPFIVMQLVHGLTLADLIAEQGPLPIGWAASIGAQVCSVLAAAHGVGLVHRDLKPLNVMLEPDGWVKVLDFGLAFGVDDTSRITSTGEPTPGTPAYMAPEQLTSGVSSPASDLYALGCTLYEMLTGRPPFTGDTSFAVMTAHATAPPPPVRELRPDIPEVLDGVVSALLGKDAAGRPSGAGTVLRALLPYAGGADPLPGALDQAAAGAPRQGYAQAVAALFAARRDRAPSRPAATTSTPAVEAPSDPLAELAAQRRLADGLFARSEFGLAAAAYDALGSLLSAMGAGPDQRFDCRLQAATCLALAGQQNLALKSLLELLDEQRLARGADDERILKLRHQVSLLQWTCGRQDAARAGLRELQAHVERLRGPADELSRQIRADAERIAPSSRDRG